MQQYEATQPVFFYSGKVKIDEKQAALRLHNLKPIKPLKTGLSEDGVYEITGQICFKAKENFGYDGAVNKSLAQLIQPVGEIVSEKPAEDKKVSGKK